VNPDRNSLALPSLITTVIENPQHYIDNLFATTWKTLGLESLIKKAGFTKRSGIDVASAVFLLLMWKWLNVSSIAMFSRKAMEMFSASKKDVIYDLLKRENINWRGLNIYTAKAVHEQNNLSSSKVKAFVLDDSIKTRRGKKMEGISSHFDHVTGRHVMGEQVLTLGLATEDAFLPLDSQIYMSQVKARELIQPHKDGRSVVAKRYQEAREQNKPEMSKNMISRAIRNGIDADYIVADAWFGTKRMIRTAVAVDVCAILRMKKNKMKYRVVKQGRKKEQLTAEALYAHAVRRKWKKVRGLPWKAVELEVELNIVDTSSKESQWITVKLLFVRGLKEQGKPDVGKKDWALFLSTDSKISMSKMLEVYALRWSIEVYFKEAKQHLGFLAEQTWTFASHTASIHLCAIRYLILVQNKLAGNESRVGNVRSVIQEQLDTLNFAGNLWQIFRAIISSSLDELESILGYKVDIIMEKVDTRVRDFFARSLQLDEFTMRLEYD